MSSLFFRQTDSKTQIQQALLSHLNQSTKMVILFANVYQCDATEVIDYIQNIYPNIIIIGGNATDDLRFEKCTVFSNQCDDASICMSILQSDDLKISSDYLFNWETIGQDMTVTKAKGATVYEINNTKAIEIYRFYLGDEVANNLTTFGIEFPLVFDSNGVNVARALVAFDAKEGSITFAGMIPENTKVRFGFANIDHIANKNSQDLSAKNRYKSEAIFIYTCAARRQLLDSFLDTEIKLLGSFGPTTGFVTYGEFYHNQKTSLNSLLNITTTFVCCNESEQINKVTRPQVFQEAKGNNVRLKAISTLLMRTSQDLSETISYLDQFKNLVDSASIITITDPKGKIKYANKNFEDISGYSQEELKGQRHNIVKHEDMDKDVFKTMWKTIQSGKLWKGIVKNRKKDGSSYYVISEIAPIYDSDGSLKEYVSIRTDITELEKYKNLLSTQLHISKSNLSENINYIKQFEEALNLATAVLKTDLDNKIQYVNEKFCELSGYAEHELIGKNGNIIRHDKHLAEGMCSLIFSKLKNNIVSFETMTNMTKSGEEFITNTLFYPIQNLDGKTIECVQIMFDVTDIYRLNDEIIETQKEVVEKMGAIGEARSRETGDHVKRVAEYSYLLARLYGMNEKEALLLKQASPMHDIGKVAIPDNILKKPDKLTAEEFEVMKQHSFIGYEMLKHSNREILQASAIIAFTHHEKWDGSGYPLGKKGHEIHIYGRITAIADVFDALGHDRVYKKAWPLDKILDFFIDQRGTHFDPELIDLFMINIKYFLEIKEKYSNNSDIPPNAF